MFDSLATVRPRTPKGQTEADDRGRLGRGLRPAGGNERSLYIAGLVAQVHTS